MTADETTVVQVPPATKTSTLVSTTTEKQKKDVDEYAGSVANIEAIRNKMQALHDSCVNHSYAWRIEQANKIEKMIHTHMDEFVQALCTDLGIIAVEARGLHVQPILLELDEIRKQLKSYCTPKRISSSLALMPSFSYLYPMPLQGPGVLIFGPSNYPFSLCIQPALGALAAGNPVVIKPSEHCPTVATVIEKYMHEYFDPSIVRVIQGSVPEATALLSKSWGLIFFTGSQTVGKIVAAAAAATLTPTVLELGGKAPCIIDPETINPSIKFIDWPMIANRILWSKFMTAGQTCAAADTLFLSEDTLTKLYPLLEQSLYYQFGKDTVLTTQSAMGRITTHSAAKRLYKLIEEVEQYIASQKQKDGQDDTEKAKCRILFGGSKYCDVDKKFIAPTIILNPPLDCDLMKEEIFGPILSIITVSNRDEAIQFVRNHMPPTPLVMYVFTTSDSTYQEYITKLRAGSVMRNDCLIHLSSSVIPFGGIGTSGYGTYHGKYTLETFTHWTPSMYRPLVPGSDFNLLRFHPFDTNPLKRWLFTHLYLIPNVPVLFLKEVTVTVTLAAIVIGILGYKHMLTIK
jgi:acyl-CoA reductase-like NAD-dependent aldehyde dehydrogenase